MDKAKRAQTAETLKQPSLRLTLRAPYLYPDRAYSANRVNRVTSRRRKKPSFSPSSLGNFAACGTLAVSPP
jgi:hypothetical protein